MARGRCRKMQSGHSRGRIERRLPARCPIERGLGIENFMNEWYTLMRRREYRSIDVLSSFFLFLFYSSIEYHNRIRSMQAVEGIVERIYNVCKTLSLLLVTHTFETLSIATRVVKSERVVYVSRSMYIYARRTRSSSNRRIHPHTMVFRSS